MSKEDDDIPEETRNKIKQLRNRTKSIKQVQKARDEELKDIDQDENPELFNNIKVMWDNFIEQLKRGE